MYTMQKEKSCKAGFTGLMLKSSLTDSG